MCVCLLALLTGGALDCRAMKGKSYCTCACRRAYVGHTQHLDVLSTLFSSKRRVLASRVSYLNVAVLLFKVEV